MGLLSGILQTAVDVVSLPISAVKDVAGEGENNTTKRMHKIERDISDIFDGDLF